MRILHTHFPERRMLVPIIGLVVALCASVAICQIDTVYLQYGTPQENWFALRPGQSAKEIPENCSLLRGRYLTDDDLNTVTTRTMLQSLDLSGNNKISSSGLGKILKGRKLRFLSLVDCKAIDSDVFVALSSVAELLELDLRGLFWITDGHLSLLRQCSGLQTIVLQSGLITSNGVCSLGKLSSLRSLTVTTSAKLDGTAFKGWDSSLIKRLEFIACTSISDAAIHQLDQLKCLVDLSFLACTGPTAACLATCSLFSRLVRFVAPQAGFVNDDVVSALLQSPVLVEVDISNCLDITPAVVGKLAAKESVQTLRLRYFDHEFIIDPDLTWPISSAMITFDLRGCRISNKTISSILKLRHVTFLNLAYSKGWTSKSFCSLDNESNIEALDVSGVDCDAKELTAAVSRLSKLRFLWLAFVPTLCDECLAQIPKRLFALVLHDNRQCTDTAIARFVELSSGTLRYLWLGRVEGWVRQRCNR